MIVMAGATGTAGTVLAVPLFQADLWVWPQSYYYCNNYYYSTRRSNSRADRTASVFLCSRDGRDDRNIDKCNRIYWHLRCQF